ncbi:MAG TPA: NAD(P)H-dependent oxidoreductase [Gaiellales bacterium]|nr:NAD(P)H-dependent oxidoreductase [Gaiellales bacterium]
MTPLVVLSHPEPTSFAAALARTAAETLDATLLDLYAEGFDPRLSAADFTNREDPARLRPMEEQLNAVRTGTFAPDVARHVELLRGTDLLVMVQPLWWFSLPAMAKGWIDRVLVNGLAYEYPGYEPWTGPLSHVRALAVFTSSYERQEFEPGGRAGSVESVLHPLLWGTFAYCGMRVLEPFIAYGADSVDDDTREGYLTAMRARLLDAAAERPLELGPR